VAQKRKISAPKIKNKTPRTSAKLCDSAREKNIKTKSKEIKNETK
jgi:hypothetical protein